MFLLDWGKKEKRLDPAYYIPSIVELEDMVRERCENTRLSHYVKQMAGGATPKIEDDTKYSTSEDGVPFIRVQNLTSEGVFSLNDVKYISQDTHKHDLGRSAFCDQDLIVKITGVGRMAIASIPPIGFCGNINQHSVRITTGNRGISETLAAYLNLDFVEKLASRRATGGTRPALDYPALRSIPVIFDGRIAKLMANAREQKEKAELEAQKLLDSVDDYLLGELGITITPRDNSLNNRMFFVSKNDISGDKWASYWIKNKEYKIRGGIYPNRNLREVASIKKGQSITKDKVISGCYPVIAGGQVSPYSHEEYNTRSNCITVSASGAYAGYVWYHNYPIFASDCSVIRSIDENAVSTIYLYEILKLKQKDIYMLQQGSGQPHVYPIDLATVTVPIPNDIEIQNSITTHISTIREKAKSILENAEEEFRQAIKGIENLILTSKN